MRQGNRKYRGKRPSQSSGRKHRRSDADMAFPFEGPKQVTIRDLGIEGDGVAQTEEGVTLFIDNALPGETVDAVVTGKAGRAWRGRVAMRHNDADMRQPAPCPHYADCGGCALQHVTPDAYRQLKKARLQSLMTDHHLDPALLSDVFEAPTGSRRRTGLHIRKTDSGIRLGYLARRSHRIADIQQCLILSPALEALFAPLKEMADRLLKEGEGLKCHLTQCDEGQIDLVLMDLSCPDSRFTNPAAVQWLGNWGNNHQIARITLMGKNGIEPVLHLSPLRLSIGEAEITPPPAGFLQASREAEAFMIETALRWLGKFRRGADLFCGAGTFTLPMGNQGKIIAMENHGPSLDALKGVTGKIRYRPDIVERDLFQAPLSFMEMKKLDVILFDPPRAGAEAQAQMIAKGKVPTVVAVSCNPVSLMRDINILLQADYVLQEMVAIDQFLWSPHLEAMALLTLSS